MDSSLLPNRSAFTRQQGSRVYGYGPDSVSIRLTGPKREKSSVSRLDACITNPGFTVPPNEFRLWDESVIQEAIFLSPFSSSHSHGRFLSSPFRVL